MVNSTNQEINPKKNNEKKHQENKENSDNEIDLGEIGDETEVDLDTRRISTYPKENPSEEQKEGR